MLSAAIEKIAFPSTCFASCFGDFRPAGEVDRYAAARIETILGEFLDGPTRARESYENYLNRRSANARGHPLQQRELLGSEIDKFTHLLDVLSSWLVEATNYSEREWQKMVVGVILLLFPKYVAVLENVKIADFYTNPRKRKKQMYRYLCYRCEWKYRYY